MRIQRGFRRAAAWLTGGIVALVVGLMGTANAGAAPTLRFGVPEWPGVVVQSQVAADLLEAMGYQTKQLSASPAFSLQGLAADNLDIYLGGWIPTEEGMITPMAKQKKVLVLGTNIAGALMGLAVPDYVWAAGVHTDADLNKFADKFGHKIYGIEAGSGFNEAIAGAIKKNEYGLGKWTLVQSSTPAMLAQVGNAIQNKQWIVFLGWQPHSMNIMWKLNYLEAADHSPKGDDIAHQRSDVLTVVNPLMVKRAPDAVQFLKQFRVPKDVMSQWIFQYKVKNVDPKVVAKDWIAANLGTVEKWVNGVKTLDGKPAMSAIRAHYAN